MLQSSWQDWITLWIFSPLLVAIAWTDLTRFKIPNTYCLIGAGLFLVTTPFLEFNDILLRVAVAAFCFAICLGLFVLGWIGGGDAKVLPIVFLAVPLPAVSTYLLLLSFSMAFGLTTLAVCRRLVKQPSPTFEVTIRVTKFPMGIAIGSAGLLLAGLSAYLVQF